MLALTGLNVDCGSPAGSCLRSCVAGLEEFLELSTKMNKMLLQMEEGKQGWEGQ